MGFFSSDSLFDKLLAEERKTTSGSIEWGKIINSLIDEADSWKELKKNL
jgi:hypothetical protein